MRFSIALTSALVAVSYAAPFTTRIGTPAGATGDISARDVEESAFEQESNVIDMIETEEHDDGLERRQVITGVAVAVATAVGTDLAMKAADAAIKASGNLIKAVKNWTSARESFTKSTVNSMYSKMPQGMSAAICYNMGYKFANNKHSGPVKAKLSASALHTDYDCMYMAKGNTFTANGDGGYINLATKYAAGCKYDSKKRTLTC